MSYEPGTAVSTSVPFPILGWNTKDPLDQMEPGYAVSMDNIFPEERNGSLWGGSESYVTSGMGSSGVKTLTTFVKSDGNEVFLAATNGNIYNISTSTAVSLGSGFTNDAWQVVDINGKKLFFNGDDQCQQFDGTTLSNAAYTGSGLTDNDLIQGTAYRGHLYVVQKNSKSFWYHPTLGGVTGGLTEFPLAPYLSRGGNLMFVTTWTRDQGAITSELFVAVSSEGEVLIFTGNSPDLDGFSLVGHIFLAKPLSRRAYLNYRSEVEVITQEGVVPLSAAVSAALVPGQQNTLTDKISSTFNDAAFTYATNFGWEAVIHPKGKRIYYNIPIVDGTQSHQYVRNSLTGAWSRRKGWNATSWGVFNDELYFGTGSGQVVKADSGDDDRGSDIEYNLQYSYNYLGDERRVKHFKKVKPIIISTATIEMGIEINTDFESKPVTNIVTVTGPVGADWDLTDWDTADWADADVYIADWYDVDGIGRAGSIHMAGQVGGATFSISATHIVFDVGGFL